MMDNKGSARLVQRPPAEEILDHFVSGDIWRVPSTIRIDVVGRRDPTPVLRWSGEPPFREVHAGPGLLEDFLKLERAKDDAILRYARRWGPLWLCDHDLPFGHADGCSTAHSVQHRDGDPRQRIDWWQEDLAGWRAVSREAGVVVRLARQLHNGQLGPRDSWDSLAYLPRVMFDLLYSPPPDPLIDPADFSPEGARGSRDLILNDEFLKRHDIDEEDDDIEPATPRHRRLVELLGMSRLGESVEFERHLLTGVLNYWLRMAGVEPRLNWPGAKPSVHLAGQGLFAALAVQLLFECSRTDGLAVCTSCGTPFLPQSRRPRRDHNPYCSDCGLKAAQRDAATRYRQTEKYRATYDSWLQKRRRPST
jgi:hypothetical protein